MSDYSEPTFTKSEKREYYEYCSERKWSKEQGVSNENDSDSSRSKVKIPANSHILKYIFRGSVEKEKYRLTDWYGKKAVASEILSFTNRKYKLNSSNQSKRRKSLNFEIDKLRKYVQKSVKVNEIEDCFQRLGEVGLRRNNR